MILSVLSLLLACGEASPNDDTALDLGPCADPIVAILAPAAGAEVPVGQPLRLSGAAEGRGPFVYLWAIDRDVVARGAEAEWTPTQAGTYELILQVDSDCGQAQALQPLVVVEN
jgi:hypothetical protein